MTKNILVTGGAGFLGSNLVEKLLGEGHKVTVIDNFCSGSPTNLESFKKDKDFVLIEKDVCKITNATLSNYGKKFDQIYHLASPASPNEKSPQSYIALAYETMMVNTQGTLKMLELAQKHNATFLFTSTSEVYGDPQVHPQPETYNGNVSTTGPRSVYDESKRMGETLVSYFARAHSVDARIARIFNTYGPNMAQSDMRMMANFVYQACQNIPITVYGKGHHTRSMCYVSDTVCGLMLLMNTPSISGEIVNIGSSHEHTILELAHLIKKVTSSKSEVVHIDQEPQDDPKQRKADLSKAKKLLGYAPVVPLEEGIVKMANYIKQTLKI